MTYVDATTPEARSGTPPATTPSERKVAKKNATRKRKELRHVSDATTESRSVSDHGPRARARLRPACRECAGVSAAVSDAERLGRRRQVPCRGGTAWFQAREYRRSGRGRPAHDQGQARDRR